MGIKIIIILFFISFIYPVVSAEKIIMLSDSFCPYSCDPFSDKKGIIVEVGKTILEKHNYIVEYRHVNWARAIVEVRKGKANALVDAYISDAPDFIFPSEAVMESKMCFFTLVSRDSWKFEGYKTLSQRKISVVNEYSYGENFDIYINKNNLRGHNNIVKISGSDIFIRRIKLLLSGRIDTILEEYLVFSYKFKNSNIKDNLLRKDKIKNVGCLQEEGMYIAFSPNLDSSEKYSVLVSNGLKKMKADGSLRNIINKYINALDAELTFPAN